MAAGRKSGRYRYKALMPLTKEPENPGSPVVHKVVTSSSWEVKGVVLN